MAAEAVRRERKTESATHNLWRTKFLTIRATQEKREYGTIMGRFYAMHKRYLEGRFMHQN
jgi:hypothetical protein